MILRRGVLPLLLVAGVAGAVASADAPNQAALVVMHGDGSMVTRCVAFAESQISGLELLQRAGLDLNLEASGVGASICRLDGEGCTFPGQSCFCQCEGASCIYWSYWRWADGAWRYAQQGATNSSVLSGALEGWVWGAGTVERAQPPPAITFDAVCAPPTPVATAASTATPTFIPTETPSFTPTASGEASATATATATAAPAFTPATISMATAPPASPTPSLATLPPAPTFTPMATARPPAAAPESPVIELFAADRREISVGESFTLAWRVAGADAVQLHAAGRAVTVAAVGALLLAPPQNTTYQLVATGAGGTAATNMTVIVRPRAPDELLPTAPAAPAALPAAATPISATPTPTTGAAVVLAATALPGAPPSPTLSPTPSPTLSPTLAPVALAKRAEPAVATLAPPGMDALPLPGGTLPVMLVGLLALAGVPLLVVAALLALWVIRRAL